MFDTSVLLCAVQRKVGLRVEVRGIGPNTRVAEDAVEVHREDRVGAHHITAQLEVSHSSPIWRRSSGCETHYLLQRALDIRQLRAIAEVYRAFCADLLVDFLLYFSLDVSVMRHEK